MAAVRAPRIPVEERLFSLVLALLATDVGPDEDRDPLDRPGLPAAATSPAATTPPSSASSSATRTTSASSACPSRPSTTPPRPATTSSCATASPAATTSCPLDISFSPEETALLTLAAMVWREGTLSAESRRALLKLRSLGRRDERPRARLRPARPQSRDAAFEPLRTALDRGVVVRFDYLKPGEADAAPTRGGALRAGPAPGPLDRRPPSSPTRASRKNFLLSRIVGPVTSRRRGRSRARPTRPPTRALAGLDGAPELNTAPSASPRPPTPRPPRRSVAAPRRGRRRRAARCTTATARSSPRSSRRSVPRSSSSRPTTCATLRLRPRATSRRRRRRPARGSAVVTDRRPAPHATDKLAFLLAARALADRPRAGQRRRGRRALRRGRERDPTRGRADRRLGHPGGHRPVPARRPLRHRLGRLRAERRHRRSRTWSPSTTRPASRRARRPR